MATRATLRTALRARLEDTSVSPLWTDSDLNEALTRAMQAYGQRIPKQATATIAIVANTIAYSLPADCPDDRAIELLDVNGNTVPRRREDRAGLGPAQGFDEQAWYAWADQLRLAQKPSTTESWTLRYLGTRELVADDVTTQPIEPAHEPIVLAFAIMWAWDRRASEDVKRGVASTDAWRQRQHAESEASRLISSTKKRVRGGWLS